MEEIGTCKMPMLVLKVFPGYGQQTHSLAHTHINKENTIPKNKENHVFLLPQPPNCQRAHNNCQEGDWILAYLRILISTCNPDKCV